MHVIEFARPNVLESNLSHSDPNHTTRPLDLPYASTTLSELNPYARAVHFHFGHINRSPVMLDLVFLALGLGLFGLFAGYAIICDRF